MQYVTSINKLANFQKELQSSTILSVDTETTGLDCFTDFITLLQVKTISDTFIFDWDKIGYKHTKYITELIQGSGLTCIFANAKFDLKFLKQHTGVMLTNVYDTMIAEVLPQQGITKDKFPSLEFLVEKYKGIKLNKEIRKQFYEGDSGITQEMLIYACEDVEYLEEIRSKQLEEIARTKQEKTLDLEMRLLPVVADMELNGVYLDREEWLELHNIAEENRGLSYDDLLEMIWKLVVEYGQGKNVLDVFDLLKIPVKTKRDRTMLASITELQTVKDFFYKKFNLNSPPQIYSLLTNLIGASTLPSTNAHDLKKLRGQYPIIENILTYRELQKSVTSFGENYLECIHPLTGRIHSSLNQHVADTGRFSSSKPKVSWAF